MQDTRHEPDFVLYFTVAILAAAGIITVYSASMTEALNHGHSASYYAVRQLIYGIAGFALMNAFMYVPVRWWYRLAAPLMAVNLALLTLVLFVGHSELGGKRWLGPGSFHLQPSELAILSTVVYLSFFFTKKVHQLYDFRRGVRPALFVIAVNFALIMMEPDMGTALTLFATALILLFASGAPVKRLIILLAAVTPVLVILALTASYRFKRLIAFVDPFHHPGVEAYQLLQGWTAISAGGWFGRGFGMSLAKTGYLPYPFTDFIFPVFVEEWGFVGASALLLTFGVLLWRGFRIARHAPDRFGALLAIGLTSSIAVATIINLGAVTGLLPVTGIPLPFISSGGTALMVDLMAMGIVLSVSRQSLAVEPEVERVAEEAAAALEAGGTAADAEADGRTVQRGLVYSLPQHLMHRRVPPSPSRPLGGSSARRDGRAASQGNPAPGNRRSGASVGAFSLRMQAQQRERATAAQKWRTASVRRDNGTPTGGGRPLTWRDRNQVQRAGPPADTKKRKDTRRRLFRKDR